MVQKKITLVLSLYNEAEGMLLFYEQLRAELTPFPQYDFEVIWINDGSKDHTQKLMDSIKSSETCDNISHVTIEFSNNFGHEAALIAGIDNATGDAVICMDSDGQHPPAAIPHMIESYNQGYEIVLMQRNNGFERGPIKNKVVSLGYQVINAFFPFQIVKDCPDFYLLSAQAIAVLKTNFRDKNRFIRGAIQSLGFSRIILPFSVPQRKFGQSSNSYWQLLRFASIGILTFSTKPLKLVVIILSFYLIGAALYFGIILKNHLMNGTPISNSSLVILILLFSFSILFFSMIIITPYLENALNEIRPRPIYIIKKISK